MRRRKIFATAQIAIAVWATACVTDPEEVNRCIDERATSPQGVYGQLIHGCDTPDCSASYAVGKELRVYDADPTPSNHQDPGIHDSGTTLRPILRAMSVTQGFYEITLGHGTHYLCTFTFKCTQVVLSSDQPRIRQDLVSGPGGGRWSAGACSKP
jgi:hypothetical protein